MVEFRSFPHWLVLWWSSSSKRKLLPKSVRTGDLIRLRIWDPAICPTGRNLGKQGLMKRQGSPKDTQPLLGLSSCFSLRAPTSFSLLLMTSPHLCSRNSPCTAPQGPYRVLPFYRPKTRSLCHTQTHVKLHLKKEATYQDFHMIYPPVLKVCSLHNLFSGSVKSKLFS